MRRQHKLKVIPTFYWDLRDGYKNFDVRKDDRAYQAGDELDLREFDPNNQRSDPEGFTGLQLIRTVNYVLRGEPVRNKERVCSARS